MAFVNERTEDGRMHTIDRERDIELRRISAGEYEDPSYEFLLTMDGIKMEFKTSLMEKVTGERTEDGKRKFDLKWEIFKLKMPASMKSDWESIMPVIGEALKAHGWNYRVEQANSITVTTSPKIEIFNM